MITWRPVYIVIHRCIEVSNARVWAHQSTVRQRYEDAPDFRLHSSNAASSACLKSSIRSAESSRPTEIRTVSLLIPASAS